MQGESAYPQTSPQEYTKGRSGGTLQPALRRQKQGDVCESEASQSYTETLSQR